MEGIVEALLIPRANAMPHYLEMARRVHEQLNEKYSQRLPKLIQYLGNPSSSDETEFDKIQEWYPAALRATCWRRENKTICLILERHNRHGMRATLLWCLTEHEIKRLSDATRSRRARISDLTGFQHHFDHQVKLMVKRAPGLFLFRRMLLDDLAVLGPEKAIPIVVEKLHDPDGEFRCEAAEIMLRMEGEYGIPHVLPLFNDPLDYVRWNVLGQIAGYGDDSVIEPLIDKLRTDPEPGVRGQAAYALGHIGSPQAIPSLIAALDNDKEEDSQGHSPSSISATALDNILGTNETRIKMEDGLCKLAPWPPDYDELKRRANELYNSWKPT
jgi:hypothetical protein